MIYQNITTDKTDTTEFKYYEVTEKDRMFIKKLYLDSCLDLCNLEIISYIVSSRSLGENLTNALYEAIEISSDCSYLRTFHSDQG